MTLHERPEVWTHCVGGGPLDGKRVGLGPFYIDYAEILDDGGFPITHRYQLNANREYEYLGINPAKRGPTLRG